MKEYKILGAKNFAHAEQQMNEMAQEGWEVVDTCYYNDFLYRIIITFSREKQI